MPASRIIQFITFFYSFEVKVKKMFSRRYVQTCYPRIYFYILVPIYLISYTKITYYVEDKYTFILFELRITPLFDPHNWIRFSPSISSLYQISPRLPLHSTSCPSSPSAPPPMRPFNQANIRAFYGKSWAVNARALSDQTG